MTLAQTPRSADGRVLAVTTRSPEETRDLAAALAAVARPGDRLALVGPLGAGKTQFAKGFARGLGVRDVVNSPSFTLMAEYEGRLPLFHQDLYRLAGAEEVLAGGLLDVRQDLGVTLSEWADRLDARLDAGRVSVTIRLAGDDARVLEIGVPADGGADRYLQAAAAWSARVRSSAGRAPGEGGR